MPAPDFAKMEEEILASWEEKKIFEKTLEKPSPMGDFVFFEGPPTANGRPGIHHVEARAFKDLIPRYKTMRGWRVARKAGWDTHGLPVELGVEKALGISGKPQIETLKATPSESIAFFNAECKKSVWTFLEDWRKITRRIGFWLDLENPYVTYETPYMESLWWAIKEIWKKDLLYKDYKIVPYCPRCGTALSSHEVAQGYKETTDPAVTVRLRAKPGQTVQDAKNDTITIPDDASFLVWTTTPWTLPANVALAVGASIEYVIAETEIGGKRETCIIAGSLASKVLPEGFKILATVRGENLVGLEYEPLYAFMTPDKPAWRVIVGDFVGAEDGTGIVHIAPAFGEDDLRVSRENGLPIMMTVDHEGKFIPEITPWAGKFVKSADKPIIEELESRGALFAQAGYTHEYPFCWRCSTPLLYYAMESWWIRMTVLKDKLVAANEEIHWVPEYIKEGRFGEWLRGVKDWAFSRERYWGTPIPIWICEKCDAMTCIGSLEELEARAGKLPENDGQVDLHRPYVDDITMKCEACDGTMRRVKEVADVWFDSGCMPFAQWHYPFENRETIDEGKAFPADYISEAIDQTRGWFYTLLAVSTLLDHGAPYKNVISLGHVLDAKGLKMSKSKGNIVDPWQAIERYGADCIRLYMYTVNQPGDPKRFDEKDVSELQRKFFMILWNVLAFYETYGAPLLDASAPAVPADRHVLDRWLMARLMALENEVTTGLEAYNVVEPGRALMDFTTDLSTWYVRRCRDRFKSGDAKDAAEAAATLRFALHSLSKLMAPFVPFTAEALYRRVGGEKESVHLEDWPEIDRERMDATLLEAMETVRKVASLGLEQRASSGIPVRQPLAKITVTGVDLDADLLAILKDELNVLEAEAEKGDALSVRLETEITPELARAGALREVIRQIQVLRKKAGLEVNDTIRLAYEAAGEMAETLKAVEPELAKAGRADSVTAGRKELASSEELEIQGHQVWIGIEKT